MDAADVVASQPQMTRAGKQRAVDVAMTRTGKQAARQVDATITAADVITHRDQAMNYALANALAERTAEILSVTDRQDALAPSTRKQYRRYQAHWMVSLSFV